MKEEIRKHMLGATGYTDFNKTYLHFRPYIMWHWEMNWHCTYSVYKTGVETMEKINTTLFYFIYIII